MTDVAASAPQPSASWIAIAPMRMHFLESYHRCLDSVCAEGRYLASSCAPELEKSRAFVSAILDEHLPMFVALIPGLHVVGWCDVYRVALPHQGHVGRLGLGIHKDYRSQGLGTLLLQRALKKSVSSGLERVELDVFSSNTTAISLYEKFGFVAEGRRRRARKYHGVYEDILTMAVFPATLAPHGYEPVYQKKDLNP